MKDHLESSIFGDHDDHADVHDPVAHDEHAAPPPASRREAREAELAAQALTQASAAAAARGTTKGKPPVWRRLLVIVLALGIIGGGVAVAYGALRPVVEGFLESNDYPGPGDGSVRVTVEQGAGGSAIARELVDSEVIKSTKSFVDAANADAKSSGIQPGVYEMKKQMRATDALAILVDPKNRIVTRVTIPEGLWASEIYPRLSKASGIPVAQYVAAAKDAKALGLPSSAKGNVEGYLFPASYEFAPDSSAASQLKQMVGESTKRLEALGITPEQMERVVVLASLVEGEASTEADRGKVARVIENRLASRQLDRLRLDRQLHLQEARGADAGDARQRQPLQHAPLQGPASRARSPTPARARSRRPRPRRPATGSTSSPSTSAPVRRSSP